MIQNQLVDYIAGQLKAGVAKDTIKSSLVGVGWQAPDVDDSFAKAESDAKPSGAATSAAVSATTVAAAKPITAAAMSSVSAGKPAAVSFSPMDIVGGGPKTESFSSSGPAKSPMTSSFTPAAGKSVTTSSSIQPMKVSDFAAGSQGMSSKKQMGSQAGSPSVASMMSKSSTPSGSKLGMIIETVGLVVLAGLAIYFYLQTSSLSAKVNNVSSTSGATAAQVASLQAQIQALTSSSTALQATSDAMTAQLTDAKTELSFLVTTTSTQPITGDISGVVIAPVTLKSLYGIRAQFGAVVYVKNSSDPKVLAIIKPLVGMSASFEGTYIPGTDGIMLTSVNGQLVNPPVVATSTAMTSTSTATSTVGTSTSQ